MIYMSAETWSKQGNTANWLDRESERYSKIEIASSPFGLNEMG